MTSSNGSSSTMIWVLAGCGLFFLLGICGLSGVGIWMAMDDDPAPIVGPAPAPPPGPTGPGTGPRPAPRPAPSPAPSPGPTGPSDPPRIVVATVTSVDGSRPVAEGATCGFSIERHERSAGRHWCRTQVVCGGKLLYGGSRSGYFDCTWYRSGSKDVVGGEDGTTSEDTDAAFEIDTKQDTMTIRDDATSTHGRYSLEARIDSVR